MPEGIRRLLLHGVDDNLAFGSDFLRVEVAKQKQIILVKKVIGTTLANFRFF